MAEAARPRSTQEVLSEAVSNLMQGKPINTQETVDGLIRAMMERWGMGGGMEGMTGAGPWQRAQPPRPPDPRAEQRARVLAARRVMGFAEGEPLTEDVIKARRTALAKRHHPDRGGSAETMAEINDATDVLVEAVQSDW